MASFKNRTAACFMEARSGMLLNQAAAEPVGFETSTRTPAYCRGTALHTHRHPVEEEEVYWLGYGGMLTGS